MGIFSQKRAAGKANIVLVHGLWADGSGWSKVIPALQEAGHFVLVVQNPTKTLAEDVDLVRQILAELDGPTVLVGHSYGGMVISEAAVNAPNVVGLVFVSALALDEGEDIQSYGAKFPALEVYQHLLVTPQGLVWLDPDYLPQYFANDLELAEAKNLAVTQTPAGGSNFAVKVGPPAWKTLPNWAIFGSEDRIIHPEQLRAMAKRSNAVTREISSSHLPFLSHPDEVVQVILEAVEATVPA